MKNRNKIFILIISIVITITIFNVFLQKIYDFNANIRTFVMNRKFSIREFTDDGLPLQYSPKIGAYRSPFYVVHYGLQYSEAGRHNVKNSNAYHWKADQTFKYWPSSPLKPSLKLFRYAADWVVKNAVKNNQGNLHLVYNFDWPYKNYPNGKLKAPWWSGLTDGHAITLMLRAWDCFGDKKYLDVAKSLYKSTLKPVSAGGSLVEFNGHPWIEEYVDPQTSPTEMSKVFNGMVYAYFGVKGFEEFYGIDGFSKSLKKSITYNLHEFDLGYWSYYDAIGSRANLKYHNVNLALIEDNRLNSPEFEEYISRWKIGQALPAVIFLIHGPKSWAYYHFIVSFLLALMVLLLIEFLVYRLLHGKK